jgi:hypothetical protein
MPWKKIISISFWFESARQEAVYKFGIKEKKSDTMKSNHLVRTERSLFIKSFKLIFGA